MKKELQLRSGTTAQHQQFIGRNGEMTVDTTLNVPVIHDGVTVGGFPVLSSVRVDYGTNFNIITPTITTPITNSTSFVGSIVSSPYTLQPVFKGLHTSTDWEIATDSLFLNMISSSYHDVSNLTRFNVTGLTTATVYIRCRYVSGVHLSSWSPTVIAVPSQTYINAPSLTVQGGPSAVPLTPTLTGSAFSIVGSTETHFSSDWTITDSAGVTVWSSIGDTVNLTSIQVPANLLTTSVPYTFAVKYRSNTLISNDGVSTASTVPPSINTPVITVQGGPSSVPENPTMTGSAYSTVGSYEVHASSYWTVKNSAGTIVWSQNTTTNLTSVNIPKNALLVGNAYSFSVQYFSASLNSTIATVQGTTVLVFAGLNTPVITVQGGPSAVPLNPLLTSSPFSILGSTETHVSTDWTVLDSAGVTVWSSIGDTVNLTSIQVPANTLTVGGTYTFGVRYNAQTLISNLGTAVNSTILNYLNAPAISIQGGPTSIPESPILTGTVYSIVGVPETHVSSDWTITNVSGTVIWSSLGDTLNLKTIKVPTGVLFQGSSYTFSVVYNSLTLKSPVGTASGSTLTVFPSVNVPTLTVQGTPSSVPENPLLTGSIFGLVGSTETHLSSDWVVKNAAGVVVWSSVGDSVNLTSITVPKGQLVQGTVYTFTVQYNTASLSSVSLGSQGTTVLNFPSVLTPTLTVQGAPLAVPENPLLTGSAFATLGTTETHLSSDWVVTDSLGVTVWSSVGDLVNLTSVTVPKGVLTVNTSYTFTVKYHTLNLVSGLGTAGGTTLAVFVYIYADAFAVKATVPISGDYAQTLLNNGDILAAGGYPASATVLQYNVANDVWTAKASMPVALALYNMSTLLDGTVLVSGGWNATHRTVVYSYDPATNIWTTKAPIITGSSHGAQVTLNSGKVMVIVGYSVALVGNSAGVQIYDPTLNSWTAGVPLPTALSSFGATVLSNGNVLVIHTTGTAYEFNISTNLWSSYAIPVSGSYPAVCTLYTGKVLVLNTTAISKYTLDPIAHTTVQSVSTTVLPTYVNSTVIPDGRVVVTGGGKTWIYS